VPTVYLGLGCNLGDRVETLRSALRALQEFGTLVASSAIYQTTPWGLKNQPDFLNLCCRLDTALSPDALHAETKNIEIQLGRVPNVRWGPRFADIDLLTYDDLVIQNERLTIPHPRIAGRAFVLVPLAEIAPDLVLPGQTETVTALAAAIPDVAQLVRMYAPSPLTGPTLHP
jgi:2-amino-4-hydroxy-6-hydroxymethyldihydropteridine diphosphokinase